MDENDPKNPPPAIKSRRPYVAPAIDESAPFEELRLTCAFDDEDCQLLGPLNTS